MATPRTSFPVAEGVGIFVGIAAWDLLSDGRMDIPKALLIAAPCAVIWFACRLLKDKWRNKQQQHGPNPKIN